jgi:hypothetical protein
MPTLSSFSTPANVQDLEQTDPAQQTELNELWSTNVTAFTEQAITGDPWNEIGAANQDSYYNPLSTDIPAGNSAVPVNWVAFPNRITQYFGQGQTPPNPYGLTQEQLWELADTGYYTDNGNKSSFPQIPATLCPEPDWTGTLHDFGPYGPRGWQDEYCEWSVTKNDTGQIIRVDFACENPEYWYSLWRINPGMAAQIYQDTLNYGLPAGSPQLITVTQDDLTLYENGNVVTDPSTGSGAYNPLNKWNSGTVSLRGPGASGGVMHLTATPNTLQTELGLAGGASVLRKIGNNDPQALICCSQYGQAYRHSDPHIGQSVNKVISAGNIASLADPVGLYIQMPDFSVYQIPATFNLPPGASAADCWQVVRGSETLADPIGGGDFRGNFILHACFQIPEEWLAANPSMTVSDIQINFNGTLSPITRGAQIVETFHIGLFARPISEPVPAALDCVLPPAAGIPTPPGSPTPPDMAQPIQMMYSVLLGAYAGTPVENPVGFPMNLASNTVIAPAVVSPGDQGLQMVLVCATVAPGPNGELPEITVPEGDISITATALSTLTYAAPGNSYPSEFQVLSLDVSVDAGAPPGLRGIKITNYGQSPGETGPGFFNVL